MERAPAGLLNRLLGALGGVACATAVGLGAYASHAASGQAQSWLQTSALYLFLHGLALLVLSPRAERRFEQAALSAIAAGMLLFCGSLIGAALFGWPTRLAPIGGSTLILAWLTLGLARLRR
ncbi:MAG: DUF423 domain-containing protein [Lysobacterales bacterium]